MQGVGTVNHLIFISKNKPVGCGLLPLVVPAQLTSDSICLLLLLPLQLPLFLLVPFVLNLGLVEVHLFPSLLRCTVTYRFLRKKKCITDSLSDIVRKRNICLPLSKHKSSCSSNSLLPKISAHSQEVLLFSLVVATFLGSVPNLNFEIHCAV